MSIKQTVEQTLYGYDPTEFMPVRVDGELQNKGEFVAYKAEQLGEAVAQATHKAIGIALRAGRVVVEHIAQ